MKYSDGSFCRMSWLRHCIIYWAFNCLLINWHTSTINLLEDCTIKCPNKWSSIMNMFVYNYIFHHRLCQLLCLFVNEHNFSNQMNYLYTNVLSGKSSLNVGWVHTVYGFRATYVPSPNVLAFSFALEVNMKMFSN